MKFMFPDELKSDCVGPRDPDSNMRLIRFYVPLNETPLEKKYRLLREDTQKWHHEFWSKHNQNFFKVFDRISNFLHYCALYDFISFAIFEACFVSLMCLHIFQLSCIVLLVQTFAFSFCLFCGKKSMQPIKKIE